MYRVLDFLLKDVKNKNELKKTAVATRFCCILMTLYLIVFGVVAVYENSLLALLIMGLFVAGYIISFVLSYGQRSVGASHIFIFVTLITVCLCVRWFGWNSGIQHFLFALVLYNILFLRMGLWEQIADAIIICAIRLGLYFYCRYFDPVCVLNVQTQMYIQIASTIFVFAILIACGVNYALENQDTENKLIKYNKELEYIASTDPLTKLWNRFKMFEYINSRLEYNGDGFSSICICDIDFFKKINDTYGHEAGDEVLRQISALLMNQIKNNGAVARWGGEEFLFFFDNYNGDDALVKLSEIRNAVKKLVVDYGDNQISFTMTFGLVEYDSKLSIDENIKIADERLYTGKQNGRDQIVY